MIDYVNKAILDGLVAAGVIERGYIEHSWPGCDGQMTCDCPEVRYVYRVAPEYRDALEERVLVCGHRSTDVGKAMQRAYCKPCRESRDVASGQRAKRDRS